MVQDNGVQQWWYSTILAPNTISNTSKFAKIVHPDFFGEDDDRSSRHSDLENQSLQVVDYDEDTGDQRMANNPFYPLYSAYYYYFHSLLPTLIHAKPSKHFQLKK